MTSLRCPFKPCAMLLLVLVVLCSSSSSTRTRVIPVTGGDIVGTAEHSARGRPFSAFRAVPYAGSPEDEHRFKPPQPVRPWRDVLLADETGPYCAQAARGIMRGEEDCLHLSVYTPQLPKGDQAEKLPVLVWLHGGAFVVSGAGDYDPRLMMDKNLVLVVPQYRLGFLGFIYAFDEAPGNYGMLDQVAALRWVQENIAQFGGDPSRVTLGGDCAGGASALYHMISPLSQGLFHSVVSVSGSPLNLWAKHPALRRTMVMFAEHLRCPRTALGLMTSCFRAAPFELLQEAQGFLLETRDVLVGNGYLAPSVQSGTVRDEAARFLQEDPLIPFTEGRFAQVPVLIMAAKDPANYILDMTLYEWMIHMEEEQGENFKDDMVKRIVKDIGFIPGGKEEKMVWEQYLPGLQGAPIDDKVPGIAQLLGDALYHSGILHTVGFLNNKVPTWLLRFDFEDGPSYYNSSRPASSTAPPLGPGAGLGDELNYFLPKLHKGFESSSQRRASDALLEVLDSFVKGETLDWPTATDTGLECAVLDQDAAMATGRYLPPARVAASEMMFERHQMSGLYKLGTPPARDEL